jgi:DNA gyrase subunit A
MDIVHEDSNIFVISELGYGKRTKVAQFTAHKRGGVGIRSAVVNTKTGTLVGVANLTEEANEVIIISSQGQTIRLGIKDISELGRATQGVRIMRLNANDSVVSLALVSKVFQEAEAEEEAEEGTDGSE